MRRGEENGDDVLTGERRQDEPMPTVRSECGAAAELRKLVETLRKTIASDPCPEEGSATWNGSYTQSSCASDPQESECAYRGRAASQAWGEMRGSRRSLKKDVGSSGRRQGSAGPRTRASGAANRPAPAASRAFAPVAAQANTNPPRTTQSQRRCSTAATFAARGSTPAVPAATDLPWWERLQEPCLRARSAGAVRKPRAMPERGAPRERRRLGEEVAQLAAQHAAELAASRGEAPEVAHPRAHGPREQACPRPQSATPRSSRTSLGRARPLRGCTS